MQALADMPLFQLSGGSDSQRREFLHRLVPSLEQGGIQAKIVENQGDSGYSLLSLVKQFDLVLLNRPRGQLPLSQIELGGTGAVPPGELSWNGGDDREMEKFIVKLMARLAGMAARIPVFGCILIGGKSSRMGQPKHLIRQAGGAQLSWLENTVELLDPLLDTLVISGRGGVPKSCAERIRIPDIPRVAGPLSGILSATRWNPMVNWLVVACDMPFISAPAVTWLLGERRVGGWGSVPRLVGSRHCEPLFALYDFRAAQIFEEQFLGSRLRVSEVADHVKIDNPVIPDSLAGAWQNINSPDQLEKI